ncbi:EscU/YscU/HrcU family type III secretion system export apparatus switch protein [Pandoraea oxalativorans]|uniref:EscU/YscU/HrcU family type III secretion system export apparatus switch protein n=1 Tax=Pandoraea oxalativorans TaxID=573737 RepID=A0A192B165_9BURK|nr:EscU/YscU/HrcU family type III secretion system export apparatus switch protein [Pandoraea oxalativorans]ANJ86767.1 EscU/YscU/HrcU family type III secretion system export apparatus switch protein [Pandoraea oxalativorans]
MSEKTEQPTEKRIQDARKEGQVAKSQEINATVQLTLTLLWLIAEGPDLYDALAKLISYTVDATNLSLDAATVVLTEHVVSLTMRFVFGLGGLLALSLTLTGLIQSGFLFAPKAIQPQAKRLNPLANAKQLVSITKLFELGKMLLKVAVLGITFTYMIMRFGPSFATLPQAQPSAGLAVCVQLAQWMWAVLAGMTAVFAVADYGMQYYQLRKQLMMSHDDIKQEHKNAEGSDEIKQRRRELQQEVQSGSLAGKVAKSSVVVRNPTHIAVCLRYEEDETPLPQVLEYGREARALEIVALAEQFEIPVVENVALARALIASTQPGDYIPETLFTAVAQVLQLVRARLDEAAANEDADEDEDADENGENEENDRGEEDEEKDDDADDNVDDDGDAGALDPDGHKPEGHDPEGHAPASARDPETQRDPGRDDQESADAGHRKP